MDFYFYTLLLITSISILQILVGDEYDAFPSFSVSWAAILSVFVIYQLAFFPIFIYDDKYNYLALFKTINFYSIFKSNDAGFSLYTFLNRSLYSNGTVFFIVTASFYVAGYWLFALKTFNKNYIFVFLLMVFASFGFTGYGVNTIRGGFALSMLFIAVAYRRKHSLFIIFALLAVLSHKSAAIPLAAFILSTYVSRHKIYLIIWFLALGVSFLNVGFISQFLQDNVFSMDDRSAGYFDAENALRYKTGFRTDFVIYSFVPIAISYYYIYHLKVKDVLYSQIFNTYLLTNSIWLLVIRMAFTDRVAYLSWFLIPVLLLYPLLKYKLPVNQRMWVAIILSTYLSFTVYMYFK